MSEIIQCDQCHEMFSNEIEGTIEYWEIESKYLCWNCKQQIKLTDCCDCGDEMYASDNEFDLWLCDNCLKKWRKQL